MSMRYRLTGLRKHRASMLIVLIAMLVLGAMHWMWMTPLMREVQQYQQETYQEQRLVEKYRKKLEDMEELQQQLNAQVKELTRLRSQFVQATDPYQMAASLSEDVFSKDKQNVEVKSYQVLSTQSLGAYDETNLKFDLLTDIRGLYHILKAIEDYETTIWVNELDVRSIRSRSGPDLRVQLIVAVLMEQK